MMRSRWPPLVQTTTIYRSMRWSGEPRSKLRGGCAEIQFPPMNAFVLSNPKSLYIARVMHPRRLYSEMAVDNSRRWRYRPLHLCLHRHKPPLTRPRSYANTCVSKVFVWELDMERQSTAKIRPRSITMYGFENETYTSSYIRDGYRTNQNFSFISLRISSTSIVILRKSGPTCSHLINLNNHLLYRPVPDKIPRTLNLWKE